MTTIPANPNAFTLFPASPVNHVINFAKLPNLSFVVQEVSLPGISATPARVQTPGLVSRHIPDRLTYEALNVTFLIDEEFRTHKELYSWLSGVTGGEDRSVLTAKFVNDQYQYEWPNSRPADALNRLGSTEAGLTIVGVDRKPKFRFAFHNLYITQLGPVQFSTTVADTNIPMTTTASFEFDYFSIVQMS